jgi:hypothetical protein
MRRLGLTLLALGVAVGTATGLAVLLGFNPLGLSWLLAVGAVKLAFAGSLGLMAGGAVFLRLHNRQMARELPPDDKPRQLT